jgi:phosphoserine phosphatase RsbU/P
MTIKSAGHEAASSVPVQAHSADTTGQRALLALLELSKALGSTVDLDALLRVIVEKTSHIVDAERTSIFIYDSVNERLWSRVAQGLGVATIELPLGSGVAGDVARTESIANIADAYQDSRFNPSFDQQTGYRTRSIICVPVHDSSGQRLLGVIQSVNKTTAERFDERDESLMKAVASHVAVALERTRLTEVTMENERLEQALRLASEIQMRMLPAGSFEAPDGSFQVRAALRPARDVGGDLYDYFHSDDHLFFCVGDVSGKGVGAALVMAMTKTLFRANAALQADPAAVITAMSARLYEETDPSMFVTAFCGALDLRSGVLRYCNAGHDRPILVPGDGGPIQALDARPGIALGVFPGFRYQTGETTLAPGDRLFLFTDGATEATKDADQLFTLERLWETVSDFTSRGSRDLVEDVLNTLDEFVAGGPQFDDITLMMIRFSSPAPTS